LCEKEKLNKFLNFIKVCHNEWMRGQHKFL
jgi:hypothetical protein